jgi:hypothetical protein
MPPVPARRRPLVGVPDGQSQHSVVDLAKDANIETYRWLTADQRTRRGLGGALAGGAGIRSPRGTTRAILRGGTCRSLVGPW